MIFGSIQSQWNDLFPKKDSVERNKRKVLEKFFVVVANVVVGSFRLDTNRIRVVSFGVVPSLLHLLQGLRCEQQP